MLLGFLLGASWRTWGGIIRSIGITLGLVFLAIAIQPFETTATRVYFAATLGLIAIGFAFAHFIASRKLVLIAWILSPFVIAILLYGAGPLPVVPTDLWGGL